MRTANTNRTYRKTYRDRRVENGVYPAWEVYGRFGRTIAVYERTSLGTDPTRDGVPKLQPNQWLRLVWVEYPPVGNL